MIQRLFSLLLLVLPALALAQSPWVVYPGSPRMAEGGGVLRLQATSPTTVWGHSARQYAAGSRNRSYEQIVFRTPDQGQTWESRAVSSRVDAGFNSPTVRQGTEYPDLSALDDQTAWLLQRDYASGRTVLLRTTSGLAGFAPLVDPLPVSFDLIHFFSATTGIAVVRGGETAMHFYRTVDGGLTWTQQLTDLPMVTAEEAGYLFAAQLTFQKHGVGASLWLSSNRGKVLRTVDEGLSWTTTPGVGAVAFEADGLHGLGYYYSGPNTPPLSRTSDGGLTWTPVPYSGRTLTAMTAVPGQPGTYLSATTSFNPLGSSDGTTAISRDRGTSWQVLSVLPTTHFTYLAAASATQVWAGISPSSSSFPGEPLIYGYTTGTPLASRPALAAALRLGAAPNPTTGVVLLSGALSSGAQVQVYDATGRLCQQVLVSERQRSVDLTAYAAGFYQLVVQSAEGIQRLPILKQN